ncbi:hypothetical protein ACSVDM_08865 [Nocardia sp. JW2]|uniref:hypothetical protein n=1 Tax=Nocardia sp. JW2 TaxID=3450738 RepID=UPI003F43860A
MRAFMIAAVGAAFLTLALTVGVWPGEAKLTAPLFCSAPTTDPLVVADKFYDGEGTSINYTLYCVGERGELTDEGFALPLLTLYAGHLAILAMIVLSTALIGRSRDRRAPVGSMRPQDRAVGPTGTSDS